MSSMRTSYYLLFGSPLALQQTADLIARRLDVEFTPHDSSYLGEYLQYAGLLADKLTIEANSEGAQDVKEPQFAQFPTLVYFSAYSGKNADKRSKARYMKTALSGLNGISLLRENQIDENS
jgi:hypothetical protein